MIGFREREGGSGGKKHVQLNLSEICQQILGHLFQTLVNHLFRLNHIRGRAEQGLVNRVFLVERVGTAHPVPPHPGKQPARRFCDSPRTRVQNFGKPGFRPFMTLVLVSNLSL